jgi:predicted acyltransferase
MRSAGRNGIENIMIRVAPRLQNQREGNRLSLALYIIGYAIVIVGLVMGAYLLDVPPRWIAVFVILMTGIAVLSAAARVRDRGSAD